MPIRTSEIDGSCGPAGVYPTHGEQYKYTRDRPRLTRRIDMLAGLCFFAAIAIAVDITYGETYTNAWAVEILGGKEHADAIAQQYGFINEGQVSDIKMNSAYQLCMVYT